MIGTLLMIHLSSLFISPGKHHDVLEREVREELERDNQHADLWSLSPERKQNRKTKRIPKTKIILR